MISHLKSMGDYKYKENRIRCLLLSDLDALKTDNKKLRANNN